MITGYVHPAHTENYQAIYFSQLYGTFFGIHAQFDCVEKDDEYEMKSINFALINYKGAINLGIVGIEGPIIDPANEKELRINIEVQALRCKKEMKLEWDGPNLKKNHHILRVDRRLKELHPEEKIVNGVFDIEFYYRDGIKGDDFDDIRRKTVKPDPNEDFDGVGGGGFVGGSICPRSINLVL